MTDRHAIVVTAAVIRRGERFLVTRRLKDTHLAGYWEFPGGKCEADESCAFCLAREIREELGCDVRIGAEMLIVAHAYPGCQLELHFFECDLVGEPAPLLGQEIRWVAREELASLEFPPADAELIRNLVEG
ncbi:MAG: (deoxy)nucleoside triphosphate pyrophosphohydrolase [Acidobacteria bacterium]|nr:(deoxy)nucleoside triphosphate pyrophosphohydrolase [Acidobacteriota bacterium]